MVMLDNSLGSGFGRLVKRGEMSLLVPDYKIVRNPVDPDWNPVHPDRNHVNPDHNPDQDPVNPDRNPVNPDRDPVNPDRNPVNPDRNPVGGFRRIGRGGLSPPVLLCPPPNLLQNMICYQICRPYDDYPQIGCNKYDKEMMVVCAAPQFVTGSNKSFCWSRYEGITSHTLLKPYS